MFTFATGLCKYILLRLCDKKEEKHALVKHKLARKGFGKLVERGNN
jgi:hypothetical protein